MTYELLLEETIWVAKTIFQRNLVTGTTGNISFRHQDIVYISQTNSCLGRLDETSFSKISMDGQVIIGSPSKEYPMHLAMYRKDKMIRSVVHTHSHFVSAMSCLLNLSEEIKKLLHLTPYLNMKTKGMIASIPFEQPGSKELFQKIDDTVRIDTDVYILKNHGVVVGTSSPTNSFGLIEEVEEACKLYFTLNMYRKSYID